MARAQHLLELREGQQQDLPLLLPGLLKLPLPHPHLRASRNRAWGQSPFKAPQRDPWTARCLPTQAIILSGQFFHPQVRARSLDTAHSESAPTPA